MSRKLLVLMAIILFCIQVELGYGDSKSSPSTSQTFEKDARITAASRQDSELREKLQQKFDSKQNRKPSDKKSGESSPRALHQKDINDVRGFYKVIIDNNLFRPLGYHSTEEDPPFELIATVVDHKFGRSKALIRSNVNHRVYYVRVGEEFADSKVERIEPLWVVVFHDGESKEFRAPTGKFISRISGDIKSSPSIKNGEPALNSRRAELFREEVKRELRDLSPEARKKELREMIKQWRTKSTSGKKQRGGNESKKGARYTDKANGKDKNRDDEKRGK